MKEFFKDKSGQLSSTRLIFIIGSFWNFIICTYLLAIGKESTTILYFFAGVQGVLAGTKIVQKQQENK